MSSDSEERSPPSGFPFVRRVITGHSDDGHSTFAASDVLEPSFFKHSDSLFTNVFWEDINPPNPNLSGPFIDRTKLHKDDLVGKQGLVMKVVDMAPGDIAPFHRTQSIDFGVVVHGEITLVLENGERQVVKAGDVFVQRGTLHQWHNESGEWTRLYTVMLATAPAKVNGIELGEEFRALLH